MKPDNVFAAILTFCVGCTVLAGAIWTKEQIKDKDDKQRGRGR